MIFEGDRPSQGADAGAFIDSFVASAQRSFGRNFGGGTAGIITPSSTSTALDNQSHNQTFIRDSFVGTITNRGPTGQSDLNGSMYWVREARDKNTETDLMKRSDWVIVDEDPYIGAPGSRRSKWVPAMNLAEYNPIDPFAEGHGLLVDGTLNVHVFATINAAGSHAYYFTSGGGAGSMIGLALVKDVYGGDSLYLKVQMLVDTDTGFNVPQTDPETELPVYVDVWCWPFLTSDHYEALVWPVNNPSPDCNPIPIVQIGSRFYAFQKLLTFPIRSPGVAHSDCPLVF